jgi:hypothetical protein
MGIRKKRYFLGLIIAVLAFWYLQENEAGFSVEQVQSSLPYRDKWASEIDPGLKPILQQTYRYLGEGAQAFAFASDDGKYVLKLFKMRRFSPSMADYFCPLLVRRRLKNLNWVFNGYKIAHDEFPEDTGVVLIHLNKTDDLKTTLTLIDEEGKSHLLDLDSSEFIVQERVEELIFDRLKRLYQEGRIAEAEASEKAILTLIDRRLAKGCADRDKAVSNNYGFIGDRPIHLDLGRLHKGVRPRQREHVEKRIRHWKRENLNDV